VPIPSEEPCRRIQDPHGLPLRKLLAGLEMVRLADETGAAFDCDTWDQVRQARVRAAENQRAAPREPPPATTVITVTTTGSR